MLIYTSDQVEVLPWIRLKLFPYLSPFGKGGLGDFAGGFPVQQRHRP
jgi:hypothetical protein